MREVFMGAILYGMTLYKPNKGNSKVLGDPRIPKHSVTLQKYSNDQIVGFRIYKRALAARRKGPEVPRWWVLEYSSLLRETLWFRPLMVPTDVRVAHSGASEDELCAPFDPSDPSEVILPMQERYGPQGSLAGSASLPDTLSEMLLERIRFKSKERPDDRLSISSLFERIQPGDRVELIHRFDREEALSIEGIRLANRQKRKRLPIPGVNDPFPCNPPGSPGFTLHLPDNMVVWPALVEARPHEKSGYFLKPPSELIEPIPPHGKMRTDEIPYHLYFDRVRNLVFVRQPLNQPEKS